MAAARGRRRGGRRRAGLVLVVLLGGIAAAVPARGAGQGPEPERKPEPAGGEETAAGVPELDAALEALRRARQQEESGPPPAGGPGEGLREALAAREEALARSERKIGRLEERLRRLEAEKAGLEEALSAARAALAARDGEIAGERREALRRLKERERELAILRRDNLSLTERLARQREEKRKIAEERARLRIDLDNAERQITELTASLEQAWKERDAADAEVEARDRRMSEQEERIAALAGRLAQAEQERDRRQARLADLEKALARADEREAALVAELVRYRRAVALAAAALEDAAAELAKARADLRARERELAALEQSNGDLVRALDETRALAERYRRILDALRERVEPETPPPAEIAPEAGPPEEGVATADDGGPDAARAPARQTIPAAVLAAGEAASPRLREAAAALGFTLRADGEGRLMAVLEGVHFAVDSTDLAPGSLPVIARLAELLRRFRDLRAIVAGHTDAVGDAAYNRRLSRARAEEVRRLLIERFDIAAERLEAVGYGEDRPRASNGDAEGRRRNRRVEVYFRPGPAGTGDGG